MSTLAFPWLRPVRPEELPALTAAAQADGGHAVLAPTHVVEKAGQLVGYLSLGAVPLIFGWFSTAQMRARDSATVLNVAENTLARSGAREVCLAFPDNSPFAAHIAALGYHDFRTAQFCLKKVT